MTYCKPSEDTYQIRIIFLHHSSGINIWNGNRQTLLSKMADKISTKFSDIFRKKAQLPLLFANYNIEFNKNYHIDELTFPKSTPYGWNNYPYDYYNIWVKNAGNIPFMEEPTLEMLTKEYQVIILKHCFPVSNIKPNQETSDINSDYKSLGNYKLQYLALKNKFVEFPDTKFIIFTGTAQI